jgi:hypothetical protein
MTSAVQKKRGRLAVTAMPLCALIASLAFAVGSAAAEEGDSAPIRPISDGGFYFPEIIGVASFEEYPFEMELGANQAMRQVDEHEIVVEYPAYGVEAYSIDAPLAHDAEGANVPTSIVLSAPEVVTIVVHHRAGNPLTGAPFVYPIIDGAGWAGGYRTISAPLGEPPAPEPPTPTAPPTPCTVPALHGLSLRTAKVRLRAAHCSIGQVRLGPNATDGTGKVVKQFHPAGTGLVAGAPVAVKLGPH